MRHELGWQRRKVLGLQHRAGAAAHQIRASRKSRAVAYIGWVGEQNLGDDLIYEAHRRTLTDALAPLAREQLAFGLSVSRALRRGHRYQMVLLGGGTLIGRVEALRMLQAVDRHVPDVPRIMLGVGVEDPSFSGAQRYYSGDGHTLASWRSALRSFEQVSVRGPRSAELLADIGVPAEVVGDPVLLFAGSEPISAVDPGCIGVNVCLPEDSWGGSMERSHADLALVLAQQAAAGRRILIVPFAPSDIAPSLELQARVGSAATICRPRDFEAFRAIACECSMFVGERLHAVVCATACFVPTLAIEYRPKLSDFQRSVGAAEFLIRSDRTDVDSIAQLIQRCVSERLPISRALQDNVTRLRRRLTLHQAEHVRLLERPGAVAG